MLTFLPLLFKGADDGSKYQQGFTVPHVSGRTGLGIRLNKIKCYKLNELGHK